MVRSERLAAYDHNLVPHLTDLQHVHALLAEVTPHAAGIELTRLIQLHSLYIPKKIPSSQDKPYCGKAEGGDNSADTGWNFHASEGRLRDEAVLQDVAPVLTDRTQLSMPPLPKSAAQPLLLKMRWSVQPCEPTGLTLWQSSQGNEELWITTPMIIATFMHPETAEIRPIFDLSRVSREPQQRRKGCVLLVRPATGVMRQYRSTLVGWLAWKK